MIKYIKLYEQYTGRREKGLYESASWADISDAINLKLPYLIIDFEDESAKSDCVNSELQGERYEDQDYILKSPEEHDKEYPSVFIFIDGSPLENKINGLYKRFRIARMIQGKAGVKHPILHNNGSKSDYGSDIMTGTGPDDMQNDDYYKFNSSYYKFLN